MLHSLRQIGYVLLLLACSQVISGAPTDDIQQQIEDYKEQISRFEAEGNQQKTAQFLTKLGYLYWQIGANADAIRNFERAVTLNEQLGNQNALRTLFNNLGLIYSEQDNFQQAISYFEKSLELNLRAGKMEGAASDYLNMALSFQSMEYFSESNNRAQQALSKALEIDNLEMAKTAYGILAENHEKLGLQKEAAGYYEKYTSLSKHLQKQQMEHMQSQSREYEQKVQSTARTLRNTLDTLGEVRAQNREMQLENALLSKENQLNAEQKARLESERQRLEARDKARKATLSALTAGLLLILVVVVMIYWQFRQKKQANKILQKQNSEIERQKLEIEEQRDLADKQRRRITDSIQYARRIQQAVLPPLDAISEHFPDFFVFYRPKDIVSGDFYWVTQKDNLLIIAAADCTGHGVPGAFMSMLGVAYLNEIVNKIAINKHISSLSPDVILNQLRDMVITSLHQTGNPEEPKDGMDISLCIIDFEHKKLQFSGANNPLYLIRKGELIVYKGDKMPVSYHQKKDISFTSHEVRLEPDDRLYLFSDGFIDQFGGKDGLKFLAKPFRELLLKIHTQPMQRQQELLEKTLDDWRGDYPQLDDVLLIGLHYGSKVPKTSSPAAANWQSKTILIAEDTDVNYFLLAAVLKETKAKLVRVKDGLEAVEFIRNNEVDLILMDINMPNMNGYDATKAIKELRSDIPVIVQTAVHFEEESDAAFKAGADDYITKPIDLKTFMAKITRFLS